MLRKITIALIFTLNLFLWVPINAQESGFELNTVVIDAGHGGKDPGATVGNIKEKDLVLDVALRTGKLIKEQFPQVNVIYTREKDVFVPLAERADIANRKKADLFISIHVNAFQQQESYGSETFILGNHRSEENLKVAQLENSVILLEDDYTTRYEGFDPNSAESYIMFELIQNEFLEQSRFFAEQIESSFINSAKRKSRGVKQAGFLVLRRTTMPSVLIELGFISNKNEVVFLVSNEGKTKMAQSIADAFINYKTRVDSRSGISANEIIAETEPPSTQLEKVAPKEINNSNGTITASNTKQPSIPVVEAKKDEPISNLLDKVETGKWYAVQIMASRTELNHQNTYFKKDFPVYTFYENGWHKYYTGVTNSHPDAVKNLNNLRSNYQGAFIVVFNNGKKE